jgi:lysophospholipase L1-like esterase
LAVFVLTGTNDVYQGQAPSWTTDRLGELVTAFETTSPRTRIVIQTVLPSAELGDGVIATNDAIRRFAADRGLDLLDLYPEFDDGSGALRDAETYDGVHLTALGYDRWASLLRPEFERLDVGSSSVTR